MNLQTILNKNYQGYWDENDNVNFDLVEVIDCNINIKKGEDDTAYIIDFEDTDNLAIPFNYKDDEYKIGKLRLYKVTKGSETKIIPVHISHHYFIVDKN